MAMYILLIQSSLRKENHALQLKAERYELRLQEIEQSTSNSDKRYETLSEEYDTLKQELHSTKLKLNETESKAAEFASQVQRHQMHIKYTAEVYWCINNINPYHFHLIIYPLFVHFIAMIYNQEIQQSKLKENALRMQGMKQNEEINNLNRDIKALFRDLETTRSHLNQVPLHHLTVSPVFFTCFLCSLLVTNSCAVAAADFVDGERVKKSIRSIAALSTTAAASG